MYIISTHTLIFCSTEGGGLKKKELSAICIRRPNTGGGLFSGNSTFTNRCVCEMKGEKWRG